MASADPLPRWSPRQTWPSLFQHPTARVQLHGRYAFSVSSGASIAAVGPDDADADTSSPVAGPKLLCLRTEPGPTAETVLAQVDLPPEDPLVQLHAPPAENETEDDVVRVFTSHRSGLLRVWTWRAGQTSFELQLTFKGQHPGPVMLLASCRPNWMVSVSTAGKNQGGGSLVKVWQLQPPSCAKSLRQSGLLASALHLLPTDADPDSIRPGVCVGTLEGELVVWPGGREDPDREIRLKKHASAVCALTHTEDTLVSCGRDRVLVFWQLKSWQPLKVVPTFEDLSCVVPCQWDGKTALLGAGQLGKLRLWHATTGKELDASQLADWTLRDWDVPSLQAHGKTIRFVQDDVLFTRSLKDQSQHCVTSLNKNDFLDMAVVANTYLVLASVSTLLKIYDLSQDAQPLTVHDSGHNDSIIGLAADRKNKDNRNFASIGKEKKIRVWKILDGGALKLLHECSGHVAGVSCAALRGSLLCSADSEGVLKTWGVVKEEDEDEDDKKDESKLALAASNTVIAHHGQSVNCMALSTVGSTLLVTGSHDKTAKVWDMRTVQVMATLTGHRRAILSVAMSPFEKNVLLTGSADHVAKVWELDTFTCVRTLEGHLSAVTRCAFSAAKLLACVSADGVLTLWDMKAPAAAADQGKLGSFENHTDKVWAMDVRADEIVTAGTDGRVVFWANNADAIRLAETKRQAVDVQSSQALDNCIQRGNLKRALSLALKLRRPKTAYALLQRCLEQGADALADALDSLKPKAVQELVGYLVQWNANSRQCLVSQFVQNHFLAREDDKALRPLLENTMSLMTYDAKHFARLSKLDTKFAIVDSLLHNM